MDKLRLVLLSLAAVVTIILGGNFLRHAVRSSAPVPTLEEAVPPVTDKRGGGEEIAAARRAMEAKFAETPEYKHFFDRLNLAFPNDYAAMLENFAQRFLTDQSFAEVDVMMAEAVRSLRQARGVMAAKADDGALARVFEMQLIMMRALAAKDQRLCVDFLYGGASQAFFQFSAENRALIAEMAIAGLEAINDGQTRLTVRQAPSDADFQILEKALIGRGLSTPEIEALLDGKTADPPIGDARMCRDGQIYLETLASLPEQTRMRIYGLAIELMARS